MEDPNLRIAADHNGKRGCLLIPNRWLETFGALLIILMASMVFVVGLMTIKLIAAGSLLIMALAFKVVAIHFPYLFSKKDHQWKGIELKDDSGRDGQGAILASLILGFGLWDGHIATREWPTLQAVLVLLGVAVLFLFLYGLKRLFARRSRLTLDSFPLRPGHKHTLWLQFPNEVHRLDAYVRYLREVHVHILEGYNQHYLITPELDQGKLRFVLELPEDGPTTELANARPAYWELCLVARDKQENCLFHENFLLPVYR